MPIGLYAENMIHDHTYVEGGFAQAFSRIQRRAREGEMIRYADPYGDTMFNRPQLKKLTDEIGAIGERAPELALDVRTIQDLIVRILRDAGYLWVSGD